MRIDADMIGATTLDGAVAVATKRAREPLINQTARKIKRDVVAGGAVEFGAAHQPAPTQNGHQIGQHQQNKSQAEPKWIDGDVGVSQGLPVNTARCEPKQDNGERNTDVGPKVFKNIFQRGIDRFIGHFGRCPIDGSDKNQSVKLDDQSVWPQRCPSVDTL